jgi:Protein of unknown function (DUF2723)
LRNPQIMRQHSMDHDAVATPISLRSPHVACRTLFSSTAVSDCSWFIALVVLSRFVFRSRFLYDIDSVNFALAVGKFDPAVHQPHPPGYFLYVMLGRLLNLLTADINTAFVLLSIAVSCGAVVMIYLLTANWFGRGAAISSALLFLFSPLAWFHGTVALTYAVECFFSALIGFLCWRLREGGSNASVLASTLGIAAGFRPSSILFLGPLSVYAVLTSRPRRLLVSTSILLGVLLSWFLPMLFLSGGPHRYFQSLLALWIVAPAKNTVLTSSIAFCVARVILIIGIGFMCFGTGIAFFLIKPANRSQVDRDRALFTWVWIAPGFLFFTLVFLLFVNSGYLLVLSPPIFAYLGQRAYAWFTEWNATWHWKAPILFAAAGANMAFFIFAPVYCSYRSVRQFEAELVSFTSVVRRTVSPSNTILIGSDSHFLGYRHAAYYLPEYLTVQYPELTIGGSRGAFAAQNRQTQYLTTLPRNHFDNFALLPLPPDDEDRAYLARVYSTFPQGELKETRSDGWTFASGAIVELKYLFAHL